MKIALAAGLACLALAATFGAPLQPSARAAEAEPVCLAAPTSGPQTRGRPFIVMLAAEDAAEMQARGYRAAPCAGRERGGAQYRSSICNFASTAPASVQKKFESDMGVAPAKLCAMAGKLQR